MALSVASQSIAGLSIAAQGIGAVGTQAQGYVAQYIQGGYTFTPPKAGYYKFVLWGAGGGATGASGFGGTSGSYLEITRFLSVTGSVALVVGSGVSNSAGQDTTATFPSGLVATAGGGAADNGTPGVATNGDVNLNGSAVGVAGGGTGGGASGGGTNGGGAPANLPFRGGNGSTALYGTGSAPGGGASASGSNMAGAPGGTVVYFVKS